jgi:putative serine protease PepD
MAEDRWREGADIDDTSAIPVNQTSVFQTYAPPGGGHPAGEQPLSSSVGAGGAGTSSVSWSSGATAYSGPAQSRRSARPRGAGLLAGALVLGLLGGGAAGFVGGRAALDGQEVAPSVVDAIPVGTDLGTPVTVIAQHALPSVVFISVGSDSRQGVGSGFVVREDGYIVTNSHVVQGAGDAGVRVTFSDGEDLAAEVVGQDEEYDIAVLKVDRTDLPVLQFGDSEALQVGASVVAVGAPLGLDNTVTSGIVSALNRPVMAGGAGSTSYINAIQTDAAINPGNSGGPLLDLSGQVVGVNSAIAQIPGEVGGGQAGSIGLGFAIPSKQAEHTATQLIETGTSNHPIIGVMLDMSYTGEGARVLEEAVEGVEPVVPGGPADGAGVQPGDIILSVDGQEIQHGSHLVIVLRSHSVGDEVELRLRGTDGEERTVTMTLQGSE